jgi:magnesium transporter
VTPEPDLNALVEAGDRGALRTRLLEMHPADVADFVDELADDQRLLVFSLLSNPVAAEVLDEAREDTTEALVEGTEWSRLSRVVEELESDAAAELIADLSGDQTEQLLLSMPDSAARKVASALSYAEDSAGRLMTTTYAAVRSDRPVRE